MLYNLLQLPKQAIKDNRKMTPGAGEQPNNPTRQKIFCKIFETSIKCQAAKIAKFGTYQNIQLMTALTDTTI